MSLRSRVIACMTLVLAAVPGGMSLPTFAQTNEPSLTLAPIRVVADKLEENISTTTLRSEAIKKIPGSLNDPLRAAQVSPGLTVESDFDTRLFIRGSAPEDSRILIDDIAAGFPFHFYGLSSTVDVNLLEDMKIYSGGFPVEYGNYMGGVIAFRTKTSREREARFNLNLIQGGAYYRSPFGEQGLVEGSFRRGFYNLVLANWHEAAVLPSYYDYFFKAGWGQLRLYTWGSEDFASVHTYLPSGQVGIADIRQISRNVAMTQRWKCGATEVFALGQFCTEGQNYFFDNQNRFEQDPKSLVGDVQARYVGIPGHRLQWRAEFAYQEPQLNIRVSDLFDSVRAYLSPGQEVYISDRISYHNYGTTLSDHFPLSPEITANLGLRWDYTTYNGKAYFSPRGQLEYELGPDQRLRLSGGVFHQEPIPLLLAAQEGTDPRSLEYGRACHYILSYELRPLSAWQQTFEAYYKDFLHLSSLSAQNIFSSDGRGYARGVEVKSQIAWTPAMRSSVSYVWSETKRYLPETRAWVYFDNDRTHQFSFMHQFDLSPELSASLRWVYSTGQPFTPAAVGAAEAINTERLPAYQRLDVRCEYRIPLDTTELSFDLDIFNLYNANNSSRVLFNNLYASAGYFRQFPFLCIVGMSVRL